MRNTRRDMESELDSPLQPQRRSSPRRNKERNVEEEKNTPLEPVVAVLKPGRRGGKPTKKATRKESKKDPVPVLPNLDSLTREDVKCAICLEIFVEPVTYPCGHTACLVCYKEHVEKTSMQCHLCRCRLSVWSRSAFKKNTLLNLPFWEMIQEKFGDEIGDRDSEDPSRSPTKNKILDGTIASQGEIFHEFDEQQKRFGEELELERQREEKASLELIQKLQDEEGPLPLVQCASELEKDLELARKLQEELEAEVSLAPPPSVSALLNNQKKRYPVVVPTPPIKTQRKLSFTQTAPPSATVSSLEEQERQAPIPRVATPELPNHDDVFQIDEDFKLAKKLQQEERKEAERERLAKLGRMSTRFLSKTKGGSPGSNNDRKRQSPRPSTPQSSKRRKQGQSSSQGTLDGYVTASPPSAAAGAPLPPPPPLPRSRSRSSTPDSINAEFNHHFQPIVRPPKTPPKRNPDGTVECTVFVNLVDRVSHTKNLSSAFTATPTKEN